MQALHLSAGQLTYRADYPEPQLQPGEALIRILVAGVCSTDLELVKGYGAFSGVLGHEFVGEVVQVEPSGQDEAAVEMAWLGRRVVGTINLGCRHCAVCLGHGPEHCPRRTVMGIIRRDGAFADFLALPLVNLLAVPDEISNETAVFTEPLAAALRISQQVMVSPTDRVAVVGPGRLGLLIGQVLALGGAPVTLFGRQPESLELPARLGFQTRLVTAAADDAFDLVVEATGNEDGLAHSLRLVRPLGTLVLKSTFDGLARVDLSALVVNEITVVGSRCGPFAPALRLLQQNAIEVMATIEAEYALREGLAAVAHAAQPGVRKVLLRP
jgi:threonine dehydrogenase-like Zn-dependent dehydrogenase